MNVEEACQAADTAVFTKTGQHLSDVQMFILRGALQGQTYEQIAATSHYSISYVKKFAGPALWELLSQGLDEPVSKTNFQTALLRSRYYSNAQNGFVTAAPATLSALRGVPNIPVFFGRLEELATLRQWVISDRCRLVMVSGIGGIGKTALAATLARQQQAAFECVLWRSLNPASTLPELLQSLLLDLLGQRATASIPGQIAQLLEGLKAHRCLLVLDNGEEILQSGALTGQYREGFQDYGELLRQLAEEDHHSCVLLLGREQPSSLVYAAGDSLPVRSLRVKGLSQDAAKQLLAAKGVDSTQSGVEELIHLKRGNPLALQLVATTIQELFDGRVAPLLKYSTVIIGDTLVDLLNEQFDRLSDLERGIIYWLALEKQSLTRLKANARYLTSSSSELLKALQSLKRRSLLEEETISEETLFTLQPVVLRYTVNHLLQQTCIDIANALHTQSLQHLGLLKSHSLFSSDQAPAQDSRSAFIPLSLINRLHSTLGDENALQKNLSELITLLQEKSSQALGYAVSNLVNIQRIAESQQL